MSDFESAERAFLSAHGEIRDSNEQLRAFESPKIPATLYHYTTIAGLTGMIEQGDLWCSNIAFLNDATEFVYGLTQVDRALQETKDLHPQFMQDIRSTYSSIERAIDAYAACFCKRGDLLNQWHGYGHGGGGFCVGFDTHQLGQILDGRNVLLLQVEYEPLRQLGLIQGELKATFDAIIKTQATYPEHADSIYTTAFGRLLTNLSFYVTAMKDPVFQGEEEWRIVQYKPRTKSLVQDIRFRLSSGLAVPYVMTGLRGPNTNILPICEIIVGPTVN